MASELSNLDQMPYPWLKFYDAHVPARLEYPHAPLYRLLEDSARRYPERPCVRFFGRRFSFRQINAQATRFAAGLRRLGVQPGERLALLLPNSPQFFVAYYGALKAGVVATLLNPLAPPAELGVFLAGSGATAAITIPLFAEKLARLERSPLKYLIVARLADTLPFPLSLAQGWQEARLLRRAAHPGLVDLRRVLQIDAAGFTPHPSDPADLAVLIYSGGTTGTAKGIMLSHDNCTANAHQLALWGDLHHAQRGLAVLPLFHGFGMSVMLNTPVLVGGEVALLPRFKVRDVLAAIAKTRPHFFVGVPAMFAAFNHYPGIERYDLTSLEGIFVGASPLTKAVKEAFEAKTGGRMIEGYGLTEAVTAIMANPYRGLQKVGSIGLPFPGVAARIVDLEDGRPLPPGQSGEIALRSPTTMLGYYNNPAETAKALVDGWLLTGDIGHMDEDGYFYITDRKKELIIVNGFNVFPRELHEILYQHPKVKEGVAVGLPDPHQGEKIRLYVVLKDGESATAEEIIAFFKERVAGYKAPAEVEFRSELPKSIIGKILPRVLKEEAGRQQDC